MVPIAVDAGGSAQTGHLISSPVAFPARPAWILRPPPNRARPHLTCLAARLRFVLATIITTSWVVVATSRRYAE